MIKREFLWRSERHGMEKKLEFLDPELARELFGPQNENLRFLAAKTGVEVAGRGGNVFLSSDDSAKVELAASCLSQLYGLLQTGYRIQPKDIDYALRILTRDPETSLESVFRDTVMIVSKKRTITPKTLGQRDYLLAIANNDMVFGIGPAGTGKTYLAVAMAISSLLQKRVKRLVLARPAVEAGEKLGFLPGDLMEKVNPYLRPLYDALHDMLDFKRVQEMIETGVIEVAPLAFMRGRTLNNSFIILDEAQNTTPEQMKMFLTRMGFGSKAVVTGDITQIDLPGSTKSGLVQASKILRGVEGVSFISFTDADVIRHPLVGRIVLAYERHDQERSQEKAKN
jgi:phosphate starvation-inducible protein PhoH and related proteins